MLILSKICYKKKEENESFKRKTFEYYEMSAEQGNFEAMFLVANMLKERDGIIPNIETAKEL